MKIGQEVLYGKVGSDYYKRGFIIDFMLSGMVSFGSSKYSEPVYYFNVKDFDIIPYVEEDKP